MARATNKILQQSEHFLRRGNRGVEGVDSDIDGRVEKRSVKTLSSNFLDKISKKIDKWNFIQMPTLEFSIS